MGLKISDINIKDLSGEASLRCDVAFVEFNRKPKKNSFLFRELFDIVAVDKKTRLKILEDIDNIPFKYSEIGNVTKQGGVNPVELEFSNRNELVEDYFKKIEKGDIQTAEVGNILLSKVRPNLKKYVLIDNNLSEFYYTTALIQLKPKRLNKLLYYSFRTLFYENLMSISRQGKGYPTLKVDDLFCMKLDSDVINFFESNEKSLLKKIESIEESVKMLKARIIPSKVIINRVFSEEFSFDLECFKTLKKTKVFDVNFANCGKNKDLRDSVKFHRQAGEFVLKELNKITSKKIKDYIAEPIVLGKSVSPSQYNNNGKYYYLSMATIANWCFDRKKAKLVDGKYSSDNKNKAIQINDIVMARSGEGSIGKVAIIDDKELKGIFADFTMRIRLENYNSLFAYYYFRTDYFQYLVEINKKGLGNNTNIFPSQIQEFPLLDIDLEEQKRIVNKIKADLDDQQQIRTEIESKLNLIDEIIVTSIELS